jgi:hypothetical protein
MTPVFLEPKPMPYLQHLTSHNNNNNNDDQNGRNLSPSNHETLEDSKSHLSANATNSTNIHNSQFYHHHHEHEKYGL